MSQQIPEAHDPGQQQYPPQYAQPGTTPQYAQPGAAPQFAQQPAAAGPHRSAPFDASATQGARVNVLGILALVLVALPALMSFLTPLIYRQASMTTGITIVGFVLPMAQLVVLVAAAGLALAGVLQRGATRFRWAAVGALVSAVLGIVSIVGGTVGGWMLSLVPY